MSIKVSYQIIESLKYSNNDEVKEHCYQLCEKFTELRPSSAVIGDGSLALRFDGRIRFGIRGSVQIAIWVPKGYPEMPPIVYILPERMIINGYQSKLSSDGIYNFKWNEIRNLINLINDMVSNFSITTPVFDVLPDDNIIPPEERQEYYEQLNNNQRRYSSFTNESQLRHHLYEELSSRATRFRSLIKIHVERNVSKLEVISPSVSSNNDILAQAEDEVNRLKNEITLTRSYLNRNKQKLSDYNETKDTENEIECQLQESLAEMRSNDDLIYLYDKLLSLKSISAASYIAKVRETAASNCLLQLLIIKINKNTM